MFVYKEYNEDVYGLIRFAVRNVAQNLKIEHVDLMSTGELLDEIEGKDKKTFDILKSYLEAYVHYIELSNSFNSRLDKKGEPIPTTPEENEKLQEAISCRDVRRKNLIGRINNITT
jgi:hypothetical protein